LLLTCGALSAQNDEHRIRNIVLVHGAWVDGSGWKGVYDILVKDGYNVSTVQEPETSFSEDVAAAKRVVAQQDGPCILVGHSSGGAVITEAGTDRSVAGLVYVAAHMPDAGENEADDGKRFPSDLSKSTAIKKTADGLTNLDRAQFREYFAAICLRRPLSWRDRKYSTQPAISEQSSPRLPGEANRAGFFLDSKRSIAAVIEPLVSRTFFPMIFTGCGPLCRSTSNAAKSERPRPDADTLRIAFCSIARAAFHNTSQIRVADSPLETGIRDAKGTYLSLTRT
jgi:pimeloyl-ACP methyl ester carboxylesterase